MPPLDPTQTGKGAALHPTLPSSESDELDARGVPQSLREHERYRVEDLLGSGGGGQVYRAYDLRLQRMVALKLLAEHDLGRAEELLNEARAQASVEHPHVCKVYEIGAIRHRPFISMQLIAGPTLSAAADKLALDEKIQVMRDVAEALHAAHRLGFIHRDVKPGNIMLERSEAGKLTAYVTDFGLARQLEGDVARTMGVAGTPAYMAPEQAGRGQLDRRTDVYGLGATLYTLLSGRPPFDEASTVKLLMRKLEEDPPALRSVTRSLPRDLDTVVMKCLERDPLRRYESARALAEDLQRYLDGEPVQATRSRLYSAQKKLRKHRAAALLTLMVLIGVAVTAWLFARARKIAGERTRVAQILGRELERADSILRFAHLSPLHDIRPQKKLVRERLREVEALVRQRGSVVPGALEYLVGRGHLELGELDSARTELDGAWRAGFRGPEVAWALGRAYGGLYQRARLEAETIQNPDQRRAKIAEVERSLRDPALDYLRGTDGIPSDMQAYVEAQIAFYDRRDDDALQRAAQSSASMPWLYEADRLVGDLYLRRAADHRLAGNLPPIPAELEQARAAYERARAVGRSDPGVRVGLCTLWRESVSLGVEAGELPKADLASAAAACDEAAAVDPEDADAPATQAALFVTVAKFQGRQRVPVTAAAQSIAFAQKALAIDARHVSAWKSLAQAYTVRADAEADGADPRPTLALGAEALRHLLALPNDGSAYSDLGRVYTLQSEYERGHGIDPAKSAQLAIDSLQTAVTRQPSNPIPLLNLANVQKALADDAAAAGRDPRAQFETTIATLRRALALNPKYALAWCTLGTAYDGLASWALESGEDPTALLGQAIAAYHESSVDNPKLMYAWVNLAESLNTVAGYAVSHDRDPEPALDEGRAALAKARALSPDYFFVAVKEAELDFLAARWARARHRPTEPQLAAASAALSWASRRQPDEPVELWCDEAEIQLTRAEWNLADKKDARASIAAGLTAVQKALAVDKNAARAQSLLGALELTAAKAGEAPAADHARAALAALRAAFARNPRLGAEDKARLTEATALAATFDQR